MSPADFRTLLHARPFVPFRIVTSDGTVYEVRHPDLCAVGIPSVLVGYPSQTDPYAYDRWDIVSMRHIVRLEPGSAPTVSEGPEGNGEKAGK